MKFKLKPLAYLTMLAISNSIMPAFAADAVSLPVTSAYPDALKDQLPDFEHAAGNGVTFDGPASTYTGTTPPAPTLDVNTTEKNTLINWGGRGFDVGADATVNFRPGLSGTAILNYDTSGNMSIVNGAVNANGAKLFLVNPDGISDTSGSFTALISNDAENVTLGTDGRLRIKNSGDRIYGAVSGSVDTSQDLTVDLVNGDGINASNMILGGDNTTINITNPDSGSNLISNTEFAANSTTITASEGSSATLRLEKTTGENLTINNFDTTTVAGETDLSNVTVNNSSVLATFSSDSATGKLTDVAVNNGSVNLTQTGGTLIIDGMQHNSYLGNFEASVQGGAVLDIRNSRVNLNSDGDIEDTDSLPAGVEEREIENSALFSTDTGGGTINLTNSAIIAEGSIYFEDNLKVGTLNLKDTDLLVPEGNVLITPGTKITMGDGFALDSDFDPSGYTRGVIVVNTAKTEGIIDSGKQYYQAGDDYSEFSSDKTITLSFNQINASGGGAMENRSEFESVATTPSAPSDVPNSGNGQEIDPPVVNIPQTPDDGSNTTPGGDETEVDPDTDQDGDSGTSPGNGGDTSNPGDSSTTPGTGGSETTPGSGDTGTGTGTGTGPTDGGSTDPDNGDTGTTPGTDPNDGTDTGTNPDDGSSTDPDDGNTGTTPGTDPDDGTDNGNTDTDPSEGGSTDPDNGGTDAPGTDPDDGSSTDPDDGGTGTTPGADPDDGSDSGDTGTDPSDNGSTDPNNGGTGTTPGTDPDDGSTDPDGGENNPGGSETTPGTGETDTDAGGNGSGTTPGTNPGDGSNEEGSEPGSTDPSTDPDDGSTTVPGGDGTETTPGTGGEGSDGNTDTGTGPVDGGSTDPDDGTPGTTPGSDNGSTTEPGEGGADTSPGTTPPEGTGGTDEGNTGSEGTPGTDPVEDGTAAPGAGGTETTPGGNAGSESGGVSDEGGSTSPGTSPDQGAGGGGAGDNTGSESNSGGESGSTPGSDSGGTEGSNPGAGGTDSPATDSGSENGGNSGTADPDQSGNDGSGSATQPGGSDGNSSGPGENGTTAPGESSDDNSSPESSNDDIINGESGDPLIDQLLESPEEKQSSLDEQGKECENPESSQDGNCEQAEAK